MSSVIFIWREDLFRVGVWRQSEVAGVRGRVKMMNGGRTPRDGEQEGVEKAMTRGGNWIGINAEGRHVARLKGAEMRKKTRTDKY